MGWPPNDLVTLRAAHRIGRAGAPGFALAAGVSVGTAAAG
jgi:hypothetical protein